MTTTEPAQAAAHGPDDGTPVSEAGTGHTGPQAAQQERPVDELSDSEARATARNAWRANPALTGAELAAQFGRSERWGRQQIAAARAANGTDGTPERQQPARAGTPETAHQRQPTGATGKAPARAATAGSRSARAVQRQTPVPLALVAVTVAAVALVTVVCAVVSYSHIRDLAQIVGMGGSAAWLPLGVDGLVVASSCSLIVDHHLNRQGHALAWAGVALGLAISLAANVLAVDPQLVSLRAVRWVLAGYTPAALAVSGHLLLRMFGQLRQPAPSAANRPSVGR